MSMLDRVLAWTLTAAYGLRSDQRGQGLAEYALILGLVAALCVGALTGLKGGINNAYNSMTAAF